ncbi:uncharacterized protein LOC123566163 [Mercenaria mercenaria]|uniref:uncharacterized protein LOC123566163 n=1 Tax=Mercenaria mercenaria TaxID=6596 RepID=UPI00234F9CE8|nr:uncharacterized protein LOC123566163 [Mercenaria mercenaria]
MDIRVRKLRNGEKVESLSRSYPTSGKPSCFPQCFNTSTESISSDRCRSPKLGQYRKLPTKSECDVCQIFDKNAVNLKCLHTFCPGCLERHKISKNGCPVCVSTVEDGERGYYSTTEEKCGPLTDDFIFDDLENERPQEESLDALVDKLEFEVLSNLEDRQSAVQREIERLHVDVDKEIIKIREYVQNLKVLIDKRAEVMIKNAYDSKARHSAELARQKKVIGDFIDRVKECVYKHRHATDLYSLSDVETKKKIDSSVRNLITLSEQVTEENVHIKCTSKTLSDATLDFMGKVGVRVFLAQPIVVNLFRTFEFPGAVHSICPVNNREAWIGYQNFIQLCSKSGRHDRPLNVGEDVHDIASDTKGNIFIACHSSVKCLDTSRNLKTLFQCRKTPQGIATFENGNIAACIGNDVVVYDTEGSLVCVLGDPNSCDLKMPYKVAINNNGDVCVSDYQSSAGEVVVFDSGGRVKAKLRTDGMAPRGVACSMQGMIYVADFRADRINLYSTQGHFLNTLLSGNADGLSGPMSIALDEGGDLWIGDWKRKVRVYNQSISKDDDYAD